MATSQVNINTLTPGAVPFMSLPYVNPLGAISFQDFASGNQLHDPTNPAGGGGGTGLIDSSVLVLQYAIDTWYAMTKQQLNPFVAQLGAGFDAGVNFVTDPRGSVA